MPLRIVFMGTPDFAVPTLEKLVERGHDVVAVYSQPPRPAGRGMAPKKSPVHRKADQLGLEVRTPAALKSEEDQAEFSRLNADVAVVVAYGLLLPPPVLEAPKHGCYNGHASLLPRWRGAAPIQRAIMAGDRQTGVMIMKMDQGLDTGPVALTSQVAIAQNMTAGELHDILMVMTADLMATAMDQLDRGTLPLNPQSDEGITYASKLQKSEARIDWARPAEQVHNHIRGLSPYPGAWSELDLSGSPVRIKILSATLSSKTGAPGEVLDNHLTIACGTGSVKIERLQRAGKQAVTVEEFLRGNSVPQGSKVL